MSDHLILHTVSCRVAVSSCKQWHSVYQLDMDVQFIAVKCGIAQQMEG